MARPLPLACLSRSQSAATYDDLAESTEQEIAERFKKKVAREIRPVTTFTTAKDYHQNYHTVNPVGYKFYKWNCGWAQRLEQIWENLVA